MQQSQSLRQNHQLLAQRKATDCLLPHLYDGSGGSATDCADAIVHSLKTKLLGKIPNGKIWNLSGDNGGGDSGNCLFQVLEELGQIDRRCPCDREDLKYARVSNCGLHNGSLMNENAITKTMGVGGVEHRTAPQALHAQNDAQNSMDRIHFELLVAMAVEHKENNTPYEDMDPDGILAAIRRRKMKS